jgi:hypothetical protein
MYCSSCGAAVPPGLSYCNRCGADLRAEEQTPAKRSGPSPDSLVWGIVSVTVVGLFLVIALMVFMKDLHFNDGLINGFAVAAFLSFLLVDILFAWLLLSSRRDQRKSSDLEQLKAELTRELGAALTHSLAEPGQSVTEHTTRTLEPVVSKRGEQGARQ